MTDHLKQAQKHIDRAESYVKYNPGSSDTALVSAVLAYVYVTLALAEDPKPKAGGWRGSEITDADVFTYDEET